MTKEYHEQLERALEQFDLEASRLALNPTLEQATITNIASLNWADLMYHSTNGDVTEPQVYTYIRDINGCLEVLELMKLGIDDEEIRTMNKEKLKKTRRSSSHIGAYIDQMNQRLNLVLGTFKPTPDYLIPGNPKP